MIGWLTIKENLILLLPYIIVASIIIVYATLIILFGGAHL
jgi:hypothetical protein